MILEFCSPRKRMSVAAMDAKGFHCFSYVGIELIASTVEA